MQNYIKKMKEEIEEYLREDIVNEDKTIDYILINPFTSECLVFASDGMDEMIQIDSKGNIIDVPEWDYNYDKYIFEYLQKGYQIEYMNNEIHYNIWNFLDNLYSKDIENKEGVQKYLVYCLDNDITKEYLNEKLNINVNDIMDKLEIIEDNELFDYKGYRIEVVENNYDNPTEKIINIYENEQKYIDGEILETISLNSKGLKTYTQEYIDENFILPKDKSNELNYFTFVLGYDLLNKKLVSSSTPECDISYDICKKLAEKFIASEEYYNLNESSYTMLEKWVNNNRDFINECINDVKQEKGRILEDGTYIIDIGNCKDQSVALIRKGKGEYKEYIIAFNYKIKDKKIDWAYGYYYNKNFIEAQNDFNKVINGDNLDKTMQNENSNIREIVDNDMIKNKYPIGTRIKLINMKDNYAVPSGTCGTVEYIDDKGQIGMKWDNGRTLSLIYGVDSFEIINENEKALFHTKIAVDMKHNGEIVEVLNYTKGKDVYSDRYTIKFNDGTINDNIMRSELKFNYSKKKDERER